MQKQMVEYKGEISIRDEMSKGVKVKTRKARKLKRKYAITSTDKIPIIMQNTTKSPTYPKL